jgi:hypothetical protein
VGADATNDFHNFHTWQEAQQEVDKLALSSSKGWFLRIFQVVYTEIK